MGMRKSRQSTSLTTLACGLADGSLPDQDGYFIRVFFSSMRNICPCSVDTNRRVALEFIYIRMLIIEYANYLRFLKPISVILPLAITLTTHTEHESTLQVIVSYGKVKWSVMLVSVKPFRKSSICWAELFWDPKVHPDIRCTVLPMGRQIGRRRKDCDEGVLGGENE